MSGEGFSLHRWIQTHLHLLSVSLRVLSVVERPEADYQHLGFDDSFYTALEIEIKPVKKRQGGTRPLSKISQPFFSLSSVVVAASLMSLEMRVCV